MSTRSLPPSTTPNGNTHPSLARTLRGLSRLCDAWGAYPPGAAVATCEAMWTVSVVVDMVATELETLASSPRGARRGRRRMAAAPDDNVRWLTRRLRELGGGSTDGI